MKQQKIKTLTIINFNSLMLMVFDCSPFLYRYRLWNSDNENARSYTHLSKLGHGRLLFPLLYFSYKPINRTRQVSGGVGRPTGGQGRKQEVAKPAPGTALLLFISPSLSCVCVFCSQSALYYVTLGWWWCIMGTLAPTVLSHIG